MRQYLYYFIFLAFIQISCKPEKVIKDRPNIIVMLADDMGWSDLGCYGGASRTPHLDHLASMGVRFTSMYAAAPNCSPSRAGLLTGKSPSALGMYNYRPVGHPMHLREEEITIAEILRDQGYSTSHFGKWHLGALPQDSMLNHPQPIDQGFEYSLGTENNAYPSHLNPTNFVRNGIKLPTQEGYSCQILATDVINWIERVDQQKPFFSFIAFHEPHQKVASPPELIQQYPQYAIEDAEYLANIENLDLAIGRIIQHLDKTNLLDNTIVIFLSDNGSYRQQSNEPLRAVKSYVYDGGIRVPGIIHWPKLAQKGMVINEPVGFVDLMPTICDLLQVEPPDTEQLDGISILDLLKGQDFKRNKPLYWFFYRTSPEIALRIDDMMILGKDHDTIPRTHRFSTPDMVYIKNMNLVEYELYDLINDQGQFQNLIDTHTKSSYYKKIMNQQLVEIQKNGHYWNTLPEASGVKRNKIDWVKYDR